MSKICPLMSKPITEHYGEKDKVSELHEVDCKQNKCAFWVTIYTTENSPVQCCALEAIALKNSDGHYVV